MSTKRNVKKIRSSLSLKILLADQNVSASQSAYSVKWLFGLLLVWFVVMIGLFSLPNYNQLLPPNNPLANLPTRWILLAGFLTLIWMWKKVPSVPENQWDISPWVARAWFWFFISLAIYLRSWDLYTPASCTMDDHYIHTTDIRHILDYHWYPMLFPSGWREPLFPYLTVAMWYFTPQIPGLVIVQLSNVAIDVVALWTFYLLGKEVGGRRMGIIFLGMGAICEEMIAITKAQMGNDTCVIAGALTLLFFLRVLKKPDLKHFSLWGLALGFGVFTYVPFRPWVPVVLGVMWLWVFSDPKERRFDFYRIVLGPFFLTAWAFLFLFRNSFLPEHNDFVNLLGSYPSLILTILLLSFSYVKVLLVEKEKNFSKLFGWATGAFVVGFVMAPFYFNVNYSSHVSETSAFNNAHTLSEVWEALWGNIQSCTLLLFGRSGWVANLPSVGYSFYDFFVPACVLLGLAYFVASPYWVSAFVVLLFLVCTVPGVMSSSPHSQRLVACTTPLLFIGAWGVNRLWLAALQAKYNKMMKMVCVVSILAFGGWALNNSFKIYQHWMTHWSANGIVADVARKELPTHRVYLVGYYRDFYSWTQDVMNDGKLVYVMDKSNRIDLTPDEKGKDLAILVSAEDKDDQKKIEKEFPGIPWNERTIDIDSGQQIPCLQWVEVPFDRVKQGETGLFYVHRVSPWSWQRRFYDRYGIGRGLILYEDRVVHWNDDPITAVLTEFSTCSSIKVEGNWNVKTEGEYLLKSHTANPFWLFLDGKKILKVVNGESLDREGLIIKNYKLFLKTGVHHVALVAGFLHEHRAPLVTVTAPGSSTEVPLDEYASNLVLNN